MNLPLCIIHGTTGKWYNGICRIAGFYPKLKYSSCIILICHHHHVIPECYPHCHPRRLPPLSSPKATPIVIPCLPRFLGKVFVGDLSSYKPSYKSPHLGLFFSINRIFHCLFHFFNTFSLLIALSILPVNSKYTNFFILYFFVKPFTSSFLCCYTRFFRLFVTPV